MGIIITIIVGWVVGGLIYNSFIVGWVVGGLIYNSLTN